MLACRLPPGDEGHVTEAWLVRSPWISLALCAVVYALEYALGRYEADLYVGGAKQYVTYVFEHKWLAPYQDHGRWRVSPRLLLAIGALCVMVPVAWLSLVREFGQKEVFLFLLGGVLLAEAAGCIQRARNILLFWRVRRTGLRFGRLRLTERKVLVRSAVELFSFALLYALIFLVTMNWLFLGGAANCLITGIRRRDLAIICR